MTTEYLEHDIGALLRRICGRDRSALKQLHKARGDRLYSILLHMLEDKDSAELAYLELMPRIWRETKSFDPTVCSSEHWLQTRARLLAIEILREDCGDQPFYGKNIGWDADPHLNAKEQQLRHYQVGRLNLALRGLPVRAAEMIVARFVYGISLEDLASLYNSTVSAVRKDIAIAGSNLRDTLMEAQAA